ncbi:DUF4411 family protein [Ruminococcaceae bacterium OttesenSCG-928-A11]|nr:DUF4411 family protein [Ruminococcaceae bacterium OttesenSCG-928-A11]
MPDVFLFDTNSFISPYKTYYSFDFAPGFWRCIENEMRQGRIVVLDKVHSELIEGDDDLSRWANSCDAFQIIDHRQPAIIDKYREILNYIQMSGYYNERALAEWADNKVADAWLIACALTFGYTIITFEGSSGGLNTSSPSSHPKIPDVCRHFDCACGDLFFAMKNLSFNMGM